MPSYKTHSIHGEIMHSLMQPEIMINKELMKLFCIGPDALMFTDYKTFDYQHAHKTRDFFLCMIETIKRQNLQFNPEVMAFLYGQLDHFALDVVMHPYIYYMTEKYPNKNKIPSHGLIEMWIDDYITQEYKRDSSSFYKKVSYRSLELKEFIDRVYQEVFQVKNASTKYDIGYQITTAFDSMIRSSKSKIFSVLMEKLSIGDITYHKRNDKIEAFLNLKKEVWHNPETNEEKVESIDDLWLESFDVSKDLMRSVNDYLYYNKSLKHPLLNNISYNTGLSCSEGQKRKYVKEYKAV